MYAGMNRWPGYTTTEGFYDTPVMLGAKRVKLERSGNMPINGLTDIDRPPRQGMIRLGVKKKTSGGKEYPSEVDYFILDPETPTEAERERITALWSKAFGACPKSIEIVLLSSDINEAFPQNYKRYGKSTPLKCIGDGREAVVTDKDYGKGLEQIGTDDRGFMKVRCAGRDCVYATTNEKSTAKECKATATLTVKIPQLGGLGVWQLTTGSFNSIVNINSSIRDLVLTYGRAHGIPLMLERRSQDMPYKGKKTTHYPLHINETPGTAKAAEALQPGIDPDEAPPEILDGDHETAPPTTPVAAQEPEPLDDVPPFVPPPCNKDIAETKQEDVAEKDKQGAEQSKEFLEGLKEDSKEEYGVEGGKATKSRAIDKEKAKTYPVGFPKFMAFCKQKLEEAELGDMYRDAFHLYSIKNPAELAKDPKKQEDVRAYLESLLEEKELV
jgi:hypothetical protein